MSAFPLALNHFPSLLLASLVPTPPVFFCSGSPRRPVPTPPVLFSSGSPRCPVPILTAAGSHRPAVNWRCSCYGSDPMALMTYLDELQKSISTEEVEPRRTMEKPELPPFIHHEYKARFHYQAPDGLRVLCYMAGVRKENVKVRMEKGELIAQGKRDKLFKDEDDADTFISYKFPAPPHHIFKLNAIQAEIKDGMLRLLVPLI